MRLSCALGAGVGAVCAKAGRASNRPTNAIIPAKTRTRRFRGNDGRTCKLLNGRTPAAAPAVRRRCARRPTPARSEEHTSELQSLMRTSYAVFCLKKQQPEEHT